MGVGEREERTDMCLYISVRFTVHITMAIKHPLKLSMLLSEMHLAQKCSPGN